MLIYQNNFDSLLSASRRNCRSSSFSYSTLLIYYIVIVLYIIMFINSRTSLLAYVMNVSYHYIPYHMISCIVVDISAFIIVLSFITKVFVICCIRLVHGMKLIVKMSGQFFPFLLWYRSILVNWALVLLFHSLCTS